MSQIILGIDPGYGRTGYGVVRLKDHKISHIAHGCIETSPKDSIHQRIAEVHAAVVELIQEYQPMALCIEELFFARNVTTALNVAQARGTVILAATQAAIDIYEFKPVEVKQAVTGYGKADKKQMQEMVRMLFCLQSIPKPDDAADALAVAWCGASSLPYMKLKN
jgi:crossover junction endodeoxyribonuclease RuvC